MSPNKVSEKLFTEYIQEEIKIIETSRDSPYKFPPGWEVSRNFVEGPKGEKILSAIEDSDLKILYDTEQGTRNLLNRAFNRYLFSLYEKGKTGYQHQLAKKVYKEWMKEVASSESSVTVLVPITNIEVNRIIKFGKIELHPIIKSGRILDLENQIHKLLNLDEAKSISFYRSPYFQLFQHGSALRTEHNFKKTETFYDSGRFPPPNFDKSVKSISSFVTLLRLFKPGDVRPGNTISSLKTRFMWSGINMSGNTSPSLGTGYKLLNKNEIRRFRNYHNKLLPSLKRFNSLPLPLQIGIEYFNSSFEKTKEHERFIDLMISLDALLGTSFESTYRVSLRVAWLLTNNSIKRFEISKEVKKNMKLRGTLVHGGIRPESKHSEIRNTRIDTEEIVRKIINKLLILHLQKKLASDYKDKFEKEFVL